MQHTLLNFVTSASIGIVSCSIHFLVSVKRIVINEKKPLKVILLVGSQSCPNLPRFVRGISG